MTYILALTIAALFWVPSALAHGQRQGWPSPDDRCHVGTLGQVEWVHDKQLDVWVKWRCIKDDTGRYHWIRIEIRTTPPSHLRFVPGWSYVKWNGAKVLFRHADCRCTYWHYYIFWDGYVRRLAV